MTHFCTDPDSHGHASSSSGSALPNLSLSGTDGADTPPAPETPRRPSPRDGSLIEGNKAWTAAANVRKRWLAGSLLARRTTPREAMPFITAQLLEMPAPVRDAITRASRSSLFQEITWRTDRRYTQCPRDDAGAYFRFLASTGYELSPIEQAVAEGAPDTSDQPAEDRAPTARPASRRMILR